MQMEAVQRYVVTMTKDEARKLRKEIASLDYRFFRGELKNCLANLTNGKTCLRVDSTQLDHWRNNARGNGTTTRS